ncbi:MAG: helix-turn-helix domain-containing protein [Sediminibacterium sp.]|nr:MAG: helix-turn-helix domain-containing [Chitinophagaceae bacterium]MDP1842421.1 helix-turn-helix domain-containing protein [Sediminibacterium sp.]TXT33693.1 MAG: helix-turn-helix domain-containing protein [Chitinophagaceae bacterium]
MPGSIIRKNRELRNYTQDYVAKQMNISQNAYSKIENGYTQLTVNHLKELSRILEVSILDLLKDDFEIHKPNHIHTESITKENILMCLDSIIEKLGNKHPMKHEFYPVIMSMLQTVDTTIEHVH